MIRYRKITMIEPPRAIRMLRRLKPVTKFLPVIHCEIQPPKKLPATPNIRWMSIIVSIFIINDASKPAIRPMIIVVSKPMLWLPLIYFFEPITASRNPTRLLGLSPRCFRFLPLSLCDSLDLGYGFWVTANLSFSPMTYGQLLHIIPGIRSGFVQKIVNDNSYFSYKCVEFNFRIKFLKINSPSLQ